MYVEPESIKSEVNEIEKVVAKAARERDDYDTRFYAIPPEDSPVRKPRRKPVKPAPPDDVVPAPPL